MSIESRHWKLTLFEVYQMFTDKLGPLFFFLWALVWVVHRSRMFLVREAPGFALCPCHLLCLCPHFTFTKNPAQTQIPFIEGMGVCITRVDLVRLVMALFCVLFLF